MAWKDTLSRGIRSGFAQANPFDSNRTWDTTQKGLAPGYRQATAPPLVINTGQKNTGGGGGGSEFDKWIAEQRAAMARMGSYQPPVYKLPSFDILGNYNRAVSQAEQAVNPLYHKRLNDFLAGQAQKRAAKQKERELTRERIGSELEYELGESNVQRGRTEEDVTGALERIGETETTFQRDEGRQFADDREAMAQQVAAAGLAGTGVAGQRLRRQMEDRNLGTQDQVKEFNNQRQAKQLFKTRTFEDLLRGDNRQKKIATEKNKGVDLDFESHMEELAREESAKKFELESWRLGEIGNKTTAFKNAGIDQFLARIAGTVPAGSFEKAASVYGAMRG